MKTTSKQNNPNNKKPLISFVIPCYRSESSIESVVQRIVSTVKSDGRYDYEIICVNDCSPDRTLDVLKTLAKADSRVTVVDLVRNFGQHSALMAGFHYVNGEVVVCLDDDGQTAPEAMFTLIDKLDEGYDLATARYPVKKESLFRRAGSWMTDKMAELLLKKPKGLVMTSYMAVRRIIIDEIIRYPNPYPNVQGLILRTTNRIADVEVEHCERLNGTSGYTIGKLLHLWMNSFTSFSEKPLRLSSILGFVSAFAGFIFGIVVIVRKILNPDIILGYSSLMAVMLIMFGIVLLMLGLIGEYIGRIFMCINCSPQYVVRSVINCRDEDESSGQDGGCE